MKQANIEAKLSAVDPKLAKIIAAVIAKAGKQQINPSKATPFHALVRAIVYQSMAAKAAETIFGRITENQGTPLNPTGILSLKIGELRSFGLSQSKAAAIVELAKWFDRNRDTAKKLPSLSDDEIRKHLMSIPGIGAWTANVFLIFNLGREDVMPVNDLGIRRAMQLTYGLKEPATAKTVAEKSERWKPFRSLASIYLWQSGRIKLTAKDLKQP
jgi:DNA-3-methyladenine glycosylase II